MVGVVVRVVFCNLCCRSWVKLIPYTPPSLVYNNTVAERSSGLGLVWDCGVRGVVVVVVVVGLLLMRMGDGDAPND